MLFLLSCLAPALWTTQNDIAAESDIKVYECHVFRFSTRCDHWLLLLEDHVRVGDVVKVEDRAAEWRTSRVLTLRDFDGSLPVIPHSAITTITNMTKDFSY